MRSLMILLTVMALAVWVGSTALSQDTAADEEAIQALAAQYVEGWKNGDAATCAAIYAPDAELVDSWGRSYKGREEIENSIAEVLTTVQGSELKLERTAIRFIKPDLAVWDGTWEIMGAPEVEGQPAPTKGVSFVVAVKQEDQWMLASGQTSVPPPPPSTGQ